MRRINIKIGAVIVVYSILLTAVFIAGVFLFQFSAASAGQESSSGGAILLNGQELINAYQAKATTVDASKIITISSIGDYFTERILKNLPIITLLFCLVLMSSSFLLWTVLRRIQRRDTMRIVEKLQTFTKNDRPVSIDPAITAAYENIKEKFTDNLNDYKRLNSYLSHEQKNSISILRTSLELSGNTEYIKSLDDISHNIDDILTLSDTAVNTQRQEVDVTLTCASVCDTYRKLSDNITFQFDESDHSIILAKERWIYRAVSNLLDNAIKYGNEEPIEVAVKNQKHSVIIIVRDHGIGMDKTEQVKIFNNRYRVNELNKDGYGIGLSLVSHVCDLCGGFIWVDSIKNQGATFYLSFPEYIKSNIQ